MASEQNASEQQHEYGASDITRAGRSGSGSQAPRHVHRLHRHRGLMHCLWEIIDNAVDEALEGYCDTIDVRLHPDHSASVADNGRGIPVDTSPVKA